MVSLSGVTGPIVKMGSSLGFWVILIAVIVLVLFGSLWMRKKGKFKYPAIIFSDNGNGKLGIKFTRVGWFKTKKILGKLIDYGGERRLEVKDGRFVQQGSQSDFHEINFKVGLLLQEKHDDPKILIPIKKCELNNDSKKMIMQIAPADYRDACSKIISDSEKESFSKWETIAQVLVFGFIGVILFISIILTIQYSKNTMTEARTIYQDAMKFYEKAMERTSTVPSSTAP